MNILGATAKRVRVSNAMLLKKNKTKSSTEIQSTAIIVHEAKRSLPPAMPLAITPTFSPWTHTSDDSYIYQLSLVLATATVYF